MRTSHLEAQQIREAFEEIGPPPADIEWATPWAAAVIDSGPGWSTSSTLWYRRVCNREQLEIRASLVRAIGIPIQASIPVTTLPIGFRPADSHGIPVYATAFADQGIVEVGMLILNPAGIVIARSLSLVLGQIIGTVTLPLT